MKSWTRGELVLAFNLYCRLPFGRLHSKNPEIVEVAEHLGRTPGSVAMKLVNFASLDPVHRARDIKGLRNASKQDREIWDEFNSDWTALALESEHARSRLWLSDEVQQFAKTEGLRLSKSRLVRGFFRKVVLVSYSQQCAFCGLAEAGFLTASHIVPWSFDEKRRADPRNGISLCVLHDRAFDRGYMSIGEDYRMLVSSTINRQNPHFLISTEVLELEGSLMKLPYRFAPDADALQYHRATLFRRDSNS